MKHASRELFGYAALHVTAKDVADFCPVDLDYDNYVRAFTQILSSRTPPETSCPDIMETIGLTTWLDVSDKADEVRLHRFRTFTNAVGMVLLAGTEGPYELMPPNYLAIRLIEDAYALQDERLFGLLSPAFAEAHHRLVQGDWMAEEAPFLQLGQLVVTFLGHGLTAEVSKLADQLIAEADQHTGHLSNEFLWGCTHFNQLHDRWRHFVRLSFPAEASNDSVAALRDALSID